MPAWQAYLQAEAGLSAAFVAGSQDVQRCRYNALREGGAASFYLHHYGEVALRARPCWLPESVTNANSILGWLTPHCTMLRTEAATQDVRLLADVADALKHAVLTRRIGAREISSSDAVLVIGTAFGKLGYGEGKFGGVDEVIILAKSGPRPLSSILQNVLDAWRRVAGIPLPDIGSS